MLFTRQAEKIPIIPYYFLELRVTSHFCSLQHFSKLKKKKNTEKLVILQVTEQTLIWLLEAGTPSPNMTPYILDKLVLYRVVEKVPDLPSGKISQAGWDLEV